MTQAITPRKARKAREDSIVNIPDFIFKAINGLISENLDISGCAVVLQKDIIKRAIELSPTSLNSSTIYGNRWLNVEKAYEKAGWVVEYDKPAYNESYEASFKFKDNSKNIPTFDGYL